MPKQVREKVLMSAGRKCGKPKDCVKRSTKNEEIRRIGNEVKTEDKEKTKDEEKTIDQEKTKTKERRKTEKR
jgi:hypothetical protein